MGKVLPEEVEVFETAKDEEVDDDVSCANPFLSSSVTFGSFNSQSTDEAAECCECDKNQKPPVPPAIEHIAGNDDKSVLPSNPFAQQPVKSKYYRQKDKKFKRIKEHR